MPIPSLICPVSWLAAFSLSPEGRGWGEMLRDTASLSILPHQEQCLLTFPKGEGSGNWLGATQMRSPVPVLPEEQ